MLVFGAARFGFSLLTLVLLWFNCLFPIGLFRLFWNKNVFLIVSYVGIMSLVFGIYRGLPAYQPLSEELSLLAFTDVRWLTLTGAAEGKLVAFGSLLWFGLLLLPTPAIRTSTSGLPILTLQKPFWFSTPGWDC